MIAKLTTLERAYLCGRGFARTYGDDLFWEDSHSDLEQEGLPTDERHRQEYMTGVATSAEPCAISPARLRAVKAVYKP